VARPTRRPSRRGSQTHKLPLEQAPDAYETFQKKQEDAIKIVFAPDLVRQAAFSRMCTPHAEPRPITCAIPTLAPSI
jgi:hypothetical protein